MNVISYTCKSGSFQSRELKILCIAINKNTYDSKSNADKELSKMGS